MTPEPDEVTYDVSIKGDGVTIERKIVASLAEAIIAMLFGGAPKYVAGRPGDAGPSLDPRIPSLDSAGGERRRLSLREFLDETRAAKNPEKITAIAEYLHVQEGIDLFTWDDVKARFRSAGEGAPANFSRDFAVALKNAWVAEDLQVAGSYYVTETGRKALNGNFGSSPRATATSGTSRRPKIGDTSGSEPTTTAPSLRRRSGGTKTANWKMVDDLLDEKGRASLKEFFLTKKPTNQNEQVAVLAYKLKEATGRQGFDGHEIHTAFQMVGLRTPGNLTGVFGNMTAAGLGRVVEKRFVSNFKAEDMVKHSLPSKDAKN